MNGPQRKLLLLLMLGLMAPLASAGIASLFGSPISSPPPYEFLGTGMSVKSEVYTAGDMYLYTYRLTNDTQVQQVVSWFSVDVEGADILSVGHDTGSSVPPLWQEVGDPVISVDALFLDPYFSAGESSTVLYFFSADAPGTSTASLGRTGTVVSREIIAPVPEPATLAILALGTGLSLCRRKGN